MARKRAPSSDPTLDRRIDRLWGALPPAARGPRPAFSVERLARAAIELADREGLEAITMQRVARRVGLTTMALYRYVATKAELIDAMVEAAGSPPALDGRGGWRSKLAAWARASMAMYQQHPWVLQAIVDRPPFGPNQIGWFDAALEALRDSGLRAGDMALTAALVDNQVRGASQLALAMARNPAFTRSYGVALQRAIGDARFPALTGAAAAGAFREIGDTWSPFEFALERTLDGVEAYITRRAGSGRR